MLSQSKRTNFQISPACVQHLLIILFLSISKKKIQPEFVPMTRVFLLCWKHSEVMLDKGFIFLIETVRVKLKSPLLSLSKMAIYPSYEALNIIFSLLISSVSTLVTFSLCLYNFFTNTPFYNFLNKRLPSMSPITASFTPIKISNAVI